MNNELLQGQSVGTAESPQNTQSTITPNESSQFQESAGTDVLSQNRTLEVLSTGTRAEDPRNQPKVTTSIGDGLMGIFQTLFIGGVILIAIFTVVYKRFSEEKLNTEEPTIETKAAPSVKVKAATSTTKKLPKSAKSKAHKGKKKVSRSKRRK